MNKYSVNAIQVETCDHQKPTTHLWLTFWAFWGFILSSFYTHPIREFGSSPILGRIVWADLFGILVILSGMKTLQIRLTPITTGCFVLLASFAPGFAISADPVGTGLELAIILFLVLIYVSVTQAIQSSSEFFRLLKGFAWAAIIASGLGIWENSAHLTGLPRLMPSDIREYRSGTFRNSGQAGAYLLVGLCAILPLRYSSLGAAMSHRDRRLFDVAIALSAISILMTVKIGAYIGISVGAIGFAVYKRKIGFIVPVFILLLIFLGSIPWLTQQFPTLANRFRHKTETRLSTEVVTDDNRFIAKNYIAAFEAFEDNPFLGSGIGGFAGRYGDHEVHSTPMKLVGETGAIGCIGYLVFLYCFVVTYRNYLRFPRDNPYRDYLDLMLPFLLGCAVSWIYTYHVRKREFWILLVVVTLAGKLAGQFENATRARVGTKIDSPSNP